MGNFEEVREWTKKAEDDFEGAIDLSRRRKKPLPDLVCFHCQQCVEKYLKAFLIFHETLFPKTHDLLLLLDISKQYQPTLELQRELFEFLNPYSVQFRYPGEETTIEEAKIALVTMKKIRNIFRDILPRELNID
jgi:HEPN domain-containing protein